MFVSVQILSSPCLSSSCSTWAPSIRQVVSSQYVSVCPTQVFLKHSWSTQSLNIILPALSIRTLFLIPHSPIPGPVPSPQSPVPSPQSQSQSQSLDNSGCLQRALREHSESTHREYSKRNQTSSYRRSLKYFFLFYDTI